MACVDNLSLTSGQIVHTIRTMNWTDEKWEVVRGLAEKLGVTPEQFRKWRERGKVPGRWHVPLLALADQEAADLVYADFIQSQDAAA